MTTSTNGLIILSRIRPEPVKASCWYMQPKEISKLRIKGSNALRNKEEINRNNSPNTSMPAVFTSADNKAY
ncbi:hypothetical protein D3C72_2412230 [compost metagenome]